MADSVDEVRLYCEGVVRTPGRFGRPSDGKAVAEQVLEILDGASTEEVLSHNVFEDSPDIRPNVFVHPKNQIGGKRR